MRYEGRQKHEPPPGAILRGPLPGLRMRLQSNGLLLCLLGPDAKQNDDLDNSLPGH